MKSLEISFVFLISFLHETIPTNTNNNIPVFFINLKLLRVKDTKPQQHLFCTFVKNLVMDLSLVPNIKNLEANNFFLLAGPCAIEGEDMALRIAEKVVSITNDLKIPYVFKGSFRKANRSRIDSFTGIGDEKALKILRKVSETFHVPTLQIFTKFLMQKKQQNM